MKSEKKKEPKYPLRSSLVVRIQIVYRDCFHYFIWPPTPVFPNRLLYISRHVSVRLSLPPSLSIAHPSPPPPGYSFVFQTRVEFSY